MILRGRRGFTLIELTIVIVVISILAVISVIAYNGIQARARDVAVREAAVKFAGAIQLYAQKYNNSKMPYGGYGSTQAATSSGCADGMTGYQGYQYSTQDSSYQCTLGDALVGAGYVDADFFTKLPPNKTVDNTPKQDFITQTCSDGKTYLFYFQEAPTSDSTTKLSALLSGACSAQAIYVTNRGMGGYIAIDVL